MQPPTSPSVSLLREAIDVEVSIARYKARHAIRKPRKWRGAAVTVGAAGVIAAIAAVCSTAPWAAGAASLTADEQRTSPASSNSSVFDGALATMAKSAVTDAAAHSRTAPAARKSTPLAPQAPAPARPAAAAPARPAAPAPVAAAHAAAAAKPSVKGSASTKAAPSKVDVAVHPAQAKKAAAPAEPTLIYDSVLPSAIPSGHTVATYSDGPYAASSASVADRGTVLWIDVNGSNTKADALDVEPGDATPAGAAAWVSAKLTAKPSSTAIVYTFRNDWGQVIDNIGTLPTWMQAHVKYWIADPTGYAHILPGAAATQWYWGPEFDITSAEPGFFS